MSLPDLLHSHCIPRKGAEHALEPDAIAELLATVSDWQLNADGLGISRKFTFTDFHHTMAFVNAVAWIAHQEDHHPDMDVGYAHSRRGWSVVERFHLRGKSHPTA